MEQSNNTLVYNNDTDTSNIQNVLLIDNTVSTKQIFIDSANANTFPIVYSYSSEPNELLQLLQSKFTHINRVSFVFHDPISKTKNFIDYKPFFTDDDLILDQSAFSENVSFLKSLITQFNISNLDFLACNSLLYDNWKTFYELLTLETNVVVGASDNLSGNIKYGADWVMENTNTDITNIYFNDTIQNFSGYLNVIITIGEYRYTLDTTSNTAIFIKGDDERNNLVISIPGTVNHNGVDYNVTSIGETALNDYKAMTQLVIPNSVTSIARHAFLRCDNLNDVSFNTPSSLTDIFFGAFAGCASLTSIIIPDSVTYIGESAFSLCISLMTVTFGTGLRTIDKKAFEICALTSVTIPSNITTIGENAFNNNSNLSEFIVHSLNENYNTLEGVLFNIDKTTLIKYPVGKVQSQYTIPNTVTTISNYAFYQCTNLTDVTLNYNLTTIGNYAFYQCLNLTNNTIGNNVASIGDYAFYNCQNVTDMTFGNSVTSIGDNVFRSCDSLTSVIFSLDSNLTTIGNYTFYQCSNLTSMNIPNKVEAVGDFVFYDCGLLTSMFVPYGVLSIGNNAFDRCFALTCVSIPESVTSIGDKAFFNCVNLTSVTIPNDVTSMANYIFGDSGVKFIKLPDNLTFINDNMFYNCTSLTSVTIGNEVTGIGAWAFQNCTGLKSVNIGSKVTQINQKAFTDCTSLTSVIFDSSSNLTLLGHSAFLGCSSLTSVSIPESVTIISSHAFDACTSLTSVYIANVGTIVREANAFTNVSGNNTSIIRFRNSENNVQGLWSQIAHYYVKKIYGLSEFLRPTIRNFSIPAKTFGDESFTITDPNSTSSAPFSYSSSNPSVATIEVNSIIIQGPGATIITVKQASTDTTDSGIYRVRFIVNSNVTTDYLTDVDGNRSIIYAVDEEGTYNRLYGILGESYEYKVSCNKTRFIGYKLDDMLDNTLVFRDSIGDIFKFTPDSINNVVRPLNTE